MPLATELMHSLLQHPELQRMLNLLLLNFCQLMKILNRYEEYCPDLISHLLDSVVHHWDPVMRVLASGTLRNICESDLETRGPEVVKRAVRSFHFVKEPR